MLIDHLLKQEASKSKYQGDGLLNIKQAAEMCGVGVESFRYHVKKKTIVPLCREKQYSSSTTPVQLFSAEQVKDFYNKYFKPKNKGKLND